MEEMIEKYNDQGYIILKNIISEDISNDLLQWLNNENVEKMYNIYNKTPTVYQNLLTKNSPYYQIINNDEINDILKLIFKDKNFYFNMIKVNNKTKYIGKDIEFHQEYYNQHFLHNNNNPEDYIQLFIPLNNHNINNGCLKIIPKSHKLGLLEYEEFIDSDLNHKFRLPGCLINKLNKEIMNCELEKGDILIFNSLLIHGSSSNKSKEDRLAIVSHIINCNLTINKEAINNHYKYRKKFEIDYLKSQIDKKEKQIKSNHHVHKLNIIL